MKTRVGIFGRTQRPEIKSLGDGVASFGDRPIFQNPDAWKAYQAKPDEFDLVIVNGFSGPGQGIADYYRQCDVPVFVVEQGHIRRGEYYQLGFERLNWMPDRADSKRRLALGIEKPKSARKQEGYMLCVGQKPGDAQLDGVDVMAYMNERMLSLCRGKRRVVYRRHPLDVSGALPTVRCGHQYPDYVPFDRALEDAHSVVTFNSNAGLKAILAGVPTFCDPRAIYAGACKTDINSMESQYAIPRQKWEDTLNRICYAQWNVDELASGEAWGFIKEQVHERVTVGG